MWCGSQVRLRRLVDSTQYPFPIYADPTGRIYQLLEKTCETPGGMDPSRPSSYSATAALTNLVKSAGLKGEGSSSKAGDARYHIGAAFLFETSEIARSASPVRITWSYRLANISAHSEADVIRRMLGVKGVREDKQERLSRASKKSGTTSREKPVTLSCIYGLSKSRNSHRRTISGTQNFQVWRQQNFCL